jgi:Putative metal-binding motif
MASLRLLLTGAAAALGVGAGLGACSGDTGILLRVTRDDTAPQAIARVHLAIGVRAATDVVDGTAADGSDVRIPGYVDDTPVGELVDTSRVDLQTEPYEVMLWPSSALPDDIGLELAAIGYDGGGADRAAIAFGQVGHEVHFAPGQTLVFEITLEGVAATSVDTTRQACTTLAGQAGTVETCRGGCFVIDGDGGPVWVGSHDDIDCDGDGHATDCDDYDWTVNHMATDLCGNGKNDDCVGGVDDGTDRDGDGLTPCDGDCVDNPAVPGSADIHPGATENPHDGIDNDCSGACDEVDDVDGDTYTASGFRTISPDPIDRTCAAAIPDCNDDDAAINPGAQELDGNGIDDDCNGHCDVDADGDGYTAGDGVNGVLDTPDPKTARCPETTADCDDDPNTPRNGTPAAMIHPGAPEVCDGVDDNCDGKCDEGLDTDGDGFTVCGTTSDGNDVCTYVGSATCPGNGAACDCAEGQKLIYPGGPGPERCDGYDEGCDGTLYPADSPCFGLDTSSQCFVGSRTCDDTTPPGGFGACVLSNTPAPPEACSAFAACANDPDPIACTVRTITNVNTLPCVAVVDQSMTPAGLCPPPTTTYSALLPAASGTTLCTQVDWQLVGGPQAGDWKVGLTPPGGGTPAQKVMGQCQVELVVTGAMASSGNPTPGPAKVLVISHRGLTVQAIVIDLSAAILGCPDGSGLTCGSG